MKVRIALVGELTAEREMFTEIDLMLGQIKYYFCKDRADAELQLLVSASYTGSEWKNWDEGHGFSLCTYNMHGDSGYMSGCEQTVENDTSLRNLIGEAMCDKADAAIVVWNEDVTELSGATWEFLKIAYERNVPCIWISTKSKQTYCLWESYYKEYVPQYWENVTDPLPTDELQPACVVEKKSWMFSFWEKRRMAYLKKYKAGQRVHQSKEDYLMKPDFVLEEDAAQGEAVRQLLLHKFEQFDQAAIELNSRFQTMLYQRSVLPFITTIFLALGFYAETLIGKTLSKIAPGAALIATAVAVILAGTGFLIHGFLNFYVYRLSRSSNIYRWQKDFVTDRYMAEILRVLIHFRTYGMELNLRKLCAGDNKIYMRIKHLADDVEPANQTIDHTRLVHILKHVNEMLDDQIAYHEASMKRYQTITEGLEKWGKRIFYLGFVMVLCRGGLQFLLALRPLQDGMNDIARSFLNMLALLLPAWAVYFTTKAQQNNFSYNLHNHQDMITKLKAIQERLVKAMNQKEIPMEVVNAMFEELADIMLVEDTVKWNHQYMSTTVKPL